MLRPTLLSLALLTFNIISAQSEINSLQSSYKAYSDSGYYTEAAGYAAQISAYWTQRNNTDSTLYYRYRRMHLLGQASDFDSAMAEGERLLKDLKAQKPVPWFMGQYYYSAGRDQLFLGNFDEALANYNKSIAFETERPDTDTLTWAKAMEWKGIVNTYTGDIDEARRLNEQALALRYAIFDSTAKEIGYNLNSLASIYVDLGMAKRATDAYTKAYQIFQLQLPEGHPHTASVAANLSAAMSKLGDVAGAIKLLEASIETHEKLGMEYDLMSEYFNLGSEYISLGDAKRALPYMNKALQLADSLLPYPHFQRAGMYDGIGSIYYVNGQYDIADSLFYLALTERKAIGEDEAAKIGQSYFNIAMTAHGREDYQRAAEFYGKSYRRRLADLGELHPQTINARYGMGEMQWSMGEYEAALKTFRQCLAQYDAVNTGQYKWAFETTYQLAQSYQQLGNADSTKYYIAASWSLICHKPEIKIDLLSLDKEDIRVYDLFVFQLIDLHLGELLKREATVGGETYREAMALIKTTDGYMNKLWPLLSFESITDDFQLLMRTIYGKQLLLETRYADGAGNTDGLILRNIELSRSASVRAALQNRQAMQYANVPDSIVALDRTLRDKLKYVQAQAVEEQDEHWDELKFETENEWRAFQNRLRTDFPAWHQLRYEPSVPSAEAVKAELKRTRSSLLVFNVIDSNILVIKGTEVGFSTIHLSVPAHWDEKVLAYRKAIEERAAATDIGRLGYELYTLIWQPIAEDLSENVIIIPDGAFHYLNFETLLRAVPADDEYALWPWLLKSHNIIVRNSLAPIAANSHRAASPILALCPGFSDELKQEYRSQLVADTPADTVFAGWVQTPFSTGFVGRLRSNGRSLIGSEANEAAFRKNAASAEILHFATHAKLRDDEPLMSYLALTPRPQEQEDGYLFSYELYNQPLTASLAVLTACETGLGALRPGDGVMSLAHAFQYAGCPNVIYSLWQIDDQQSTWLMERFYENLNKEMTFSAALRKSKQDYLKNHEGELGAPYYWGGMVITGTDGTLQAKSYFEKYWIYILASIATVLSIFAFGRSRRRRNL